MPIPSIEFGNVCINHDRFKNHEQGPFLLHSSSNESTKRAQKTVSVHRTHRGSRIATDIIAVHAHASWYVYMNFYVRFVAGCIF